MEKKCGEMFERVQKRCKSNITSIIEHRQLIEESDEKKKEMKKMKKNLKQYAKMLKEGTHIADVMCVTDNGNQLVEEPILCSQDVMTRLKMLHEDEE